MTEPAACYAGARVLVTGATGFIGRIRNPNRTQLPRARALGQLNTVAPVSLHARAGRPLGHLRRCDHLALVALGLQGALQAEARGAGFIDHVQPLRGGPILFSTFSSLFTSCASLLTTCPGGRPGSAAATVMLSL